MRKKVLCLVMTGAVIAGTMTVGTGTTVYAEDFTSQGDWSVTFNGDGMESSFSSQEMADEIYGILPGDSIELKVNVQNDSREDTDWYMSNEVIKSLEEGSTAQGGAYGYQLRYVNAAGEETVLFDSDTIGGDEGEEALQDRLGSDQGGTVYLTVALDGETQGNDYQNTLAQLQMNFATEIVEPDTVQGEDKVINRTVKEADKTVYRTQRVKTGDESQTLLYSAIALVSGLVLLGLGVMALKKKKNREEGELRS
mgnify:CR=1 FL=1